MAYADEFLIILVSFLLKKSLGWDFYNDIALIVILDASISTIKSYEKSGKVGIGR